MVPAPGTDTRTSREGKRERERDAPSRESGIKKKMPTQAAKEAVLPLPPLSQSVSPSLSLYILFFPSFAALYSRWHYPCRGNKACAARNVFRFLPSLLSLPLQIPAITLSLLLTLSLSCSLICLPVKPVWPKGPGPGPGSVPGPQDLSASLL